jgi:hypothetical protein
MELPICRLYFSTQGEVMRLNFSPLGVDSKHMNVNVKFKQISLKVSLCAVVSICWKGKGNSRLISFRIFIFLFYWCKHREEIKIFAGSQVQNMWHWFNTWSLSFFEIKQAKYLLRLINFLCYTSVTKYMNVSSKMADTIV